MGGRKVGKTMTCSTRKLIGFCNTIPLKADMKADIGNVSFVLPTQLVDATQALNLSGVSNPRVLRGRSLAGQLC
jgi:hypothetical protein